MRTAVLFLVFNRPQTTSRVFEAIREARPPRLYVAADGPRAGCPGERELCEEVRSIATNADWPCEIKTLFREENLGCKHAASQGIKWFFENEEEGIILEDDVLPHQSFFNYCDELLEKYRDQTRIALITGFNFAPFKTDVDPYSYMFSRLPSIWGWASWSRFWELYDPDMRGWPEMRGKHFLDNVFHKHRLTVSYWDHMFQKVYSDEIDTWDYQLVYCCLATNLVTVVPKNNLITNIGFGPGATHTTDTSNRFANSSTEGISFPLKHPSYIAANMTYERELLENGFGILSLRKRVFTKVLRCSRFLWTRNWVQFKREIYGLSKKFCNK